MKRESGALRAVLLLSALGLLLRLIYLSGAAHSPLFTHLELDPRVNDAQAWAIAGGENPEPGPFFRAPLYVYFLAFVYTLFGHSLMAARVAQAFLGAMTVALLAGIAGTLWGRRAAILAAALGALYGPLIYFCGELVSVTLEIALLAASLLLTLRAGRPRGRSDARPASARPGARGAAYKWLLPGGAGLLLAAAAITRPTVLPFALVAAAWLFFRGGGRTAAAVYLAAALSLPLAVTARNGLLGGDWVPIASQGGINFYIGNNEHADGTTPYVPGAGSGITATYEAPARLASAATGRALRPSEVSAYWYRQGAEFWIRKPAAALALFGKKLAFVWNRRELPNNQDQKFFGPFNSFLFLLPWFPGFGFLAPIALAAAWTERRRAPLLLAYLGVTTLVTAAYFVCDRFRLPLIVAVVPLAAAGISRAYDWAAPVARRSSWPLAIRDAVSTHRNTALLLAASALAVLLPFPSLQHTETGMSWFRLARAYQAERNLSLARVAYGSAETAGLATPEFFNNYGLFELQNHSSLEAEAHFRRALQIDPRMGQAHANLAELYMRREQWETAAQEYAAAASLIPEQAAELYTNAGMLFTNVGRPSEARTMYENALRSRPGFQPALDGMARLKP